MTDLHCFPYGTKSTSTQTALEQEARELQDAEEPFFNAQIHIRAYEREFRELATLQPKKRIPEKQNEQPYLDISTTPLAGLTS